MLLIALKKLKNASQKLTLSYIRDDDEKTVTFIICRKGANLPFVIEEIRNSKPFASYAITGENDSFCFLTSQHKQLTKKRFHLINKGDQK